MFATYVEKECLWGSLKDSVWAGVGRDERRRMAVGSDDDVWCRGEASGNIRLLGISVCLLDRPVFANYFAKVTDVLLRT